MHFADRRTVTDSKADMEPFFRHGPASKAYEAIRDRGHLAGTKAFIEQLWSIYSSYADPGFLGIE